MKIYQTMFKSMIPEKEISKDILEKHIKEKSCPLTRDDQILGYLVDYKEDAFRYILVFEVDEKYKNMFSPWNDYVSISSRGENLPKANNGNAGFYFSNKTIERVKNEKHRSKN